MKQFTMLSPAKINLNLRVTGLQPDGYHTLDSVVQPVDIFDRVRIKISRGSKVSVYTDPPLSCRPQENTAYAAARLFFEEAGIKDGAEIFLKKKIPPGAGLGGGSGNAAAVLAGLNSFYGVFEEQELRRIARKIGSDAPLFIRCSACRVSGTGEDLETLKGFPLLNYVVCFPGFGCSTADVYKKWDQLKHFQNPGGQNKFWNFKPRLEMANDLEEAAFALYPRLAYFCTMLEADYGAPFKMTGSGSAFFSVFEHPEPAREIFHHMKNAGGLNCFLARGIEGWRESGGEKSAACV